MDGRTSAPLTWRGADQDRLPMRGAFFAGIHPEPSAAGVLKKHRAGDRLIEAAAYTAMRYFMDPPCEFAEINKVLLFTKAGFGCW